MKLARTLTAALLVTLAITASARAGTPSQDPRVRALQDRFEQARAPRVEDLLPGQDWICSYASAVSDQSGEPSPTRFRFVRDESHPSGLDIQGSILREGWAFTETALVIRKAANFNRGTRGNPGEWTRESLGTDAVRVGPEGELLVELALQPESIKERLSMLLLPRAVDGPFAQLIGYRECRVRKYRT